MFAYDRIRFEATESRENCSMLTVTIENFGEITTLHCLGRIVRGDETAVLCSAVQQGGRNVVLDLAQVDVIDAAGIGALVSLQAAGVYLTLLNPTEQVREVLKVTGLDSIFEICESQSTAGTTKSSQAAIPDFTYL
jgi:anti-anti-sigma factor